MAFATRLSLMLLKLGSHRLLAISGLPTVLVFSDRSPSSSLSRFCRGGFNQ
jgi:hypothetical protein